MKNISITLSQSEPGRNQTTRRSVIARTYYYTIMVFWYDRTTQRFLSLKLIQSLSLTGHF